MSRPDPPFGPNEASAAGRLLTAALQEDLGTRGDLTSGVTLPAAAVGRVNVVARQDGVVAGLPIIAAVCERVEKTIEVQTVQDGDPVRPGSVVASLSGNVRGLLTAERTVLNFLTHLSGIASLTSRFVAQTAGTSAKILDTRKTLPGWRFLAKYAVRCGGGVNHRFGLHDMVLIKDNHIAAWRQSHAAHGLHDILTGVRDAVGGEVPVMVEVDTLQQLEDVLSGRPDYVLLDNMSNAQLREAVAIRNAAGPGVQLEASGGVTLETVAGIAETGVDRISVGALTHSAPNLDLGFDWHA